MKKVLLKSGDFEFVAVMEEEKSPKTCEWLLNKLPWEIGMIHVSWSGEACFGRLLDQAWGLPYESTLRIVHPGQIIVYPGGKPELQMSGEFYLGWGYNEINCDNGPLSGNHVLTIVEGMDRLEEFGVKVHYEGLQKMTVSLLEE